MRIISLATDKSPDYYTLSGNTITAHSGDVTEDYDLSEFPEGGVFQDAAPINGVPAIRGVERIDGELYVTLCQQVGPGHWRESDWMDADDYDPDAVHVVLDPHRPFSGRAWAKTRQGKTYMTEEPAHG